MQTKTLLLLLACFSVVPLMAQQLNYSNVWDKPPQRIPKDFSVDAPLMGNGDLEMTLGYKTGVLTYYVSKSDFWRLRSQADNLSGPRLAGTVEINLKGLENADFKAKQSIRDGITTCFLQKNESKVEIRSMVMATDNLIMIELLSTNETDVKVNLVAPENTMANINSGEMNGISWLEKAFNDSVDIKTEAAIAIKFLGGEKSAFHLTAGKKTVILLAVNTNFESADPLKLAISRAEKINAKTIQKTLKQHDKWWDNYWSKSSVSIEDSILMKAYYQGLYTMASCSRNPEFPPGLFGWTTNDTPAWNGDYHLNYNFQAPFYSLYSANRIEQADPQDSPLLDFMQRGEWYAKNITNTRGILYPVGIGPLGIEVTRNFGQYRNSKNFEKGGLFFGQRSNSAYGLINMAQRWRCTYDLKYGKKIYPYALAVVDFWEDYLKFEAGRYVIYNDAIHEGSGNDKNPILSLGLVRNAFDLIIDLSSSLKINEERQAKWRHILSNLSDFPLQERNGRTVFRYTEEGVSWWEGNGLGIQHIYPANAITPDSKPELLKIAGNTIDEMKRWHDSNTSNSFFVAAIRVGYNPDTIIGELRNYALNAYPNGFQMNNPHGIENSCTVVNAVNEMLCMSAGNVIRLFSVWPKEMNAGFNNILAWGAFLVSAKLHDKIISDVKIISEKGKDCTLVNPWPGSDVLVLENGKPVSCIFTGEKVTFKTLPGKIYLVSPVLRDK